ncbi:MAG: FG-GAP repeat protein [Myxococcales bacterium]|nr:FG-GAP repeat protein [Myxococcales bacterium]
MTKTLLTVLVSASLLVAGCGRKEKCDNGADDDKDGFVDCGDQDCYASCGERCFNNVDDDGDGLVDCADDECTSACDWSPGDPEDCANGIDDDRDYIVDCADDDCDTTCDRDGDGWVRSDEPYGGLDCDDTRFEVSPGTAEVPYDGLDNDCSPDTPDDDVDGDGFLRADDCDDFDANSFPGAPETCGDGVVNDCDDTSTPNREEGDQQWICFSDRSVSTADITLLGTATDDWTGQSVSAAGDVDGDGFGDMLIGAYGEGQKHGAAYLVMGAEVPRSKKGKPLGPPVPITGLFDMADARVKWTGEGEDDWAGFSVAPGGFLSGDGNGDRPDMLIGAQYDDTTDNNSGAAYVVRLERSGTVDLLDAYAKIVGESQFDQAGNAVAGPGDVDGDGNDDILIGAVINSAAARQAGAAYLVSGPVEGLVGLEHVDYVLRGESEDDQAGCAVSGAGDLNGDGDQDIVVGACASNRNRENAGAAFQFSTHTLTERSLGEADGAMIGEGRDDRLGTSVASAGDLDDDGLADLIIGAPENDQAAVDAGKAYISYGPAARGGPGENNMNEPEAFLFGVDEGDLTGTSVAGIGDIDGDGHDDVAIGAPGRDEGGEDAGAVYVLFGPVNGSIDLADADFKIVGAAPFDFAGASVAGAGDVDGDGFQDLLVGAPFHDGTAPSGGAAYIFTFGY